MNIEQGFFSDSAGWGTTLSQKKWMMSASGSARGSASTDVAKWNIASRVMAFPVAYSKECITIEGVNAGLVACDTTCPGVVLVLCNWQGVSTSEYVM
jgi:hypothetical protein